MFTNFNFLNSYSKAVGRSFRSFFFIKFYYYLLVFFNNKILLFLFIILCNISIYLVLNDNVIYCMGDDDNNKILSSDPTYGTKKRKTLSILEGRPSFDNISDPSHIPNKEFIVRIPLSMGIQIDVNNMFQYVGVGTVLTGGGIGAAKILGKLPLNTRAGVLTTVTGMGFMYQATMNTMREVFESVRNNNSNTSSSSTNTSSSSTIISDIPISTGISNQFEIDSTIKIDNYSINAIFKDNTLTLKDLKKDNILISNEDNNKELLNENTLAQKSLEKDYYAITNNHNINSMLESGDLLSIAQNNPYFKLELLLFLGLCFLLYILLSLTIVTLINKYNQRIKEYFKNKYILMYINFNNKYINYIIFFWFLALYLIIFLLLAISYTLIYGFESYCIQTPEIVNSLILISWSKNKLFIKKNSPLLFKKFYKFQ